MGEGRKGKMREEKGQKETGREGGCKGNMIEGGKGD